MKDAGFELSKAYKTLLTGLTYAGKAVEVYKLMAPSTAVAPYVILGPWTPRKDNTKQSFGQTGEINLDVFTRFAGDQFSTRAATDIANLITALLKPTPTAEVLSVTGFQCWMTIVEAGPELALNTGTDSIYRKIITVSHSLRQL